MIEKECKDCTYYLQHYTKFKGHYRSTSFGHCTNKKSSGHFRKTNMICECFIEKDLQKEKDEQLKTATEWLSFIGKQIKEIKLLLETQNN